MTAPHHNAEPDDPPGPPHGLQVYEFVADHVGDAFADRLRTCRGAVARSAAPHHLAHFSGAVLDFSCDTLDSIDCRTPRARMVRMSQQLSLLFGGLDDTLRDVRSGALIRLVVHTTSGASYCDQIVPGQLVVGTRFENEEHDAPLPMITGVRAADIIMSRL